MRAILLLSALLALLVTSCGPQAAPTYERVAVMACTATPAPLPTPTATVRATTTCTMTATPVPTPTASPTRTATVTVTATRSAILALRWVSSPTPAAIQRGDPTRPRIALTFDAGASAAHAPKILAALRQANVRSTFFLTGKWAADNPDLVKAIVGDGHELANHSNSHPDFTTLTDAAMVEELTLTERIIRGITGSGTTRYFRPPFGALNARVLATVAKAGFQTVTWTLDSGDWREDVTPHRVLTTVLNGAANGAIVVMHVGSPQTAEVLPRIISGLRGKGYEIITLSALLTP